MVLPGFVIHLLLTEIVWAYIYNNKRRTSFIHPFVFYMTLLPLSFLALSENSVFTLEVYISHFFLSNTTTLLYSAVLFFLHYRCGDWTQVPIEGQDEKKENGTLRYKTASDHSDIASAGVHNITAYFIVCATTALIYFFCMVPPYPVGSEQNITWLLPIFFVFVAFGGAVWVEHLYDGTPSSKGIEIDDSDEKLEFLAHLVNLGHVLIILAVLLYFTGQSMILTYGDTFLPRGGLIPARAEFALATKNSTMNLLLS
jgi:hypothetical protein